MGNGISKPNFTVSAHNSNLNVDPTVADNSSADPRYEPIKIDVQRSKSQAVSQIMEAADNSSSSSNAAPPTYTVALERQAAGSSSSGSHVQPRVVKTTWTDVQFSMDLLTASQREANFLRMIDRKAPVLYEDDVVRNAIRRYEQFWLPLQAKVNDTNIVPPLDVHWIWHCHMLCPTKYREDCEAITAGTVIDHKLLRDHL